MIDVGVSKAFQHAVCIVQKLLPGQIQRGNDLVKYAGFDVGQHNRILDAAAHGVTAGEQRIGHQRGVGAVENAHLAGTVHFDAVADDHV